MKNNALLTLKQSLNKAYLKEKVARSNIELFKENLIELSTELTKRKVRACKKSRYKISVRHLLQRQEPDQYQRARRQASLIARRGQIGRKFRDRLRDEK